MSDWTFFSNYGHVLFCLAQDHESRLRDVASRVGITERAVQKIVKDLQDAGYLEVAKRGRRNRYRINNRKALRHSIQAGCTIGQLLALFEKSEAEPPRRRAEPESEQTKAPQPRPKPPKTEPPPAATVKSVPDAPKPKGDGSDQGQLF